MKSIKYCLNKQLVDICQQSIQLEELSDKVMQLLPADLASCCQVGSFNKGCLILTTSNAAWASQLRYALPELRDRLRKEAKMYQLLSIKVSILVPPATALKAIKANTPPVLTEQAKASIISESQQCSYQPLQQALLHLADA